jgi:hypothetical protein
MPAGELPPAPGSAEAENSEAAFHLDFQSKRMSGAGSGGESGTALEKRGYLLNHNSGRREFFVLRNGVLRAYRAESLDKDTDDSKTGSGSDTGSKKNDALRRSLKGSSSSGKPKPPYLKKESNRFK